MPVGQAFPNKHGLFPQKAVHIKYIKNIVSG